MEKSVLLIILLLGVIICSAFFHPVIGVQNSRQISISSVGRIFYPPDPEPPVVVDPEPPVVVDPEPPVVVDPEPPVVVDPEPPVVVDPEPPVVVDPEPPVVVDPEPPVVVDPEPELENLADIPYDWSLTYGSGPQIIGLDYDFTRGGSPSITIGPHVDGVDGNAERECDGTWYSVKPGDRIVAKVWIWVGNSADGDTSPYSGGRLGMDLYAHTSAGYGVVESYPSDGAEHLSSVVQWGTNTWVQKTIDYVVPSTGYTEVMFSWPTWNNCEPAQIDHFVLWLDVRSYTDAGKVYFADAELYINP